MLKKVAFSAVGLVLLISPLLVAAQTLTVQDQINALLVQIQALKTQIERLQSGYQPLSCVIISQNLTLGSTGDDVINLQNYLISKGYFTSASTGYYGNLTAAAVGKLQISLGIVGSSSESGYGSVGPKTRAAIGCGGGGSFDDSGYGSGGSFSASPVYGAAPLTVRFTAPNLAPGTYALKVADPTEFGDVIQYLTPPIDITHTYTTSGTFQAELRKCNSSTSTVPPCQDSSIVGSATITATSSH